MRASSPTDISGSPGGWLSLERQGPILAGVLLLLGLWRWEVIEPFALGLPAYAIYVPLSEVGRQLGFVGIEGSQALFWVSASVWLYLFCAVALFVTIRLTSRFGETP